jgi:predicted transcriptional regulator
MTETPQMVINLGDWLDQQKISRNRFCTETQISYPEMKRIIDGEIDPRGSTIAIILAYAALHGGGLHIDGLLSKEALVRVRELRASFEQSDDRA